MSASAIDLNEAIVSAWLEAASDLGVTVIAPYRLGRIGDQTLLCEALLPDFGSQAGAIAITARSRRRTRPILREANRWHSELGDGYANYKRKLFVETLNDWGWYGQEHLKPDWYTGEPWR